MSFQGQEKISPKLHLKYLNILLKRTKGEAVLSASIVDGIKKFNFWTYLHWVTLKYGLCIQCFGLLCKYSPFLSLSLSFRTRFEQPEIHEHKIHIIINQIEHFSKPPFKYNLLFIWLDAVKPQTYLFLNSLVFYYNIQFMHDRQANEKKCFISINPFVCFQWWWAGISLMYYLTIPHSYAIQIHIRNFGKCVVNIFRFSVFEIVVMYRNVLK